MKYFCLFIYILFFSLACVSQNYENETLKNRYVLGFLPSQATNIYGIALGLIGSEVRCDKYYTKNSHGINFQVLGQGLFTPFFVFNRDLNWSNSNKDSIIYGDSTNIKRVVHNGLLISAFGTFSEDINGVSVSPLMSMNHKINGLSLNLLINSTHTLNGMTMGLYNSTYFTKGVQFGLFNQTNKLRGIQIGIWNVNRKRKLPFINWSFRN